jgi:hypothetical protein
VKDLPEPIRVEAIAETPWEEMVRPYPRCGSFYVYQVGREIVGVNCSRYTPGAWDKLRRPAEAQGARFNGRYWVCI